VHDNSEPGSAKPEPPHAERPRRVATYALVCVVFLAAALVGGLVLAGARSALHASPNTPSEQAWIYNPLKTNQGIRPGDQLFFVVIHPVTGSISWTSSSAGHVIESGAATGTSGESSTVVLDTRHAKQNAWLRISVGGLRTPLQIWVR